MTANLSAMTREQLEAMVTRFQAQAQRKLTLKVSAKGAVSLYGMGRFPVTLYAAQWDKVLSEAEAIREFIKTHEAVLSSGKDDPRFANAVE